MRQTARALVALLVLIATTRPTVAWAQLPMPSPSGAELPPIRLGVYAAGTPVGENQLVSAGLMAAIGGSRRLGGRIDLGYVQFSRPRTSVVAPADSGRELARGVVGILNTELGGRLSENVIVYATVGTGFAQLSQPRTQTLGIAASLSSLAFGFGLGARVSDKYQLDYGSLNVGIWQATAIKFGVFF
jgi:hypothetical protein